jgi:hypothetical protein
LSETAETLASGTTMLPMMLGMAPVYAAMASAQVYWKSIVHPN